MGYVQGRKEAVDAIRGGVDRKMIDGWDMVEDGSG